MPSWIVAALLVAVTGAANEGEAAAAAGPAPVAAGDMWPGFRGLGTSLTSATDLPLKWSATEGVAWRTELPGYGQSSPLVWKQLAVVTSASGDQKAKLHVLGIEVATGKIRWQAEFPATQKVAPSDYVSRAAPTPAMDAERIYALFESGDLFALDHAGKLLWKRGLVTEYGAIAGAHGLGSSLAQSSDAVFVLVDHDGGSYLLAVDKKTGANLWKVERSNKTAWSSPLVNTRNGTTEVLIAAAGRVDAYAADTGKHLWWVQGLDGNNVPSPSIAGDLLFVGATAVDSNIAVKLGGTGDVSATHVAWRSSEASSSFASPLVFGDQAYYTNRTGVTFCLDRLTGKVQWKSRLAASCWASAVGAGDRVYFFTKDGVTQVFKAGAKQEELAENKLDLPGRVYGIAPINGAFLIRTGSWLAAVGKPAAAE